MKCVSISALFAGVLFSSFAYSQIEIFCTKQQCKQLGLSTPLLNTTIFVLDKHLISAEEINETVLKGVVNPDEARQKLKNNPKFNKMVEDLKQAGIGLQKFVSEYKLKKLPAFVCIKSKSDQFRKGVIYGGNFQSASSLCTNWKGR